MQERNYNGALVPLISTEPQANSRLPIIALVTGTLVWGTIWYPYRILADAGLGALCASVLTYVVAFALCLVLFFREILVKPNLELFVLALAAGFTNVGYIWATNHGIILHVLLLFYLMPVWTVLFSWLLLDALPSVRTLILIAIALAGAAIMLAEPGSGLPIPANPAEWAALGAGMAFALSNVLVHRASSYTARCKSIWILGGCVVLGALGAPFFEALPTAFPSVLSMLLVVLIGLTLLAVNICVQYGLERLPPARVPLIYLFELVVAALASWILAGEAISSREMIGGAMILFATVAPKGADPLHATGRAAGTAP